MAAGECAGSGVSILRDMARKPTATSATTGVTKKATKETIKKVAAKAPAAKAAGGGAKAGDPAAYLAALEHPRKRELLEAREVILSAAPGITETIKWSTLSFRAADDFATFHPRETKGLAFVFHTGVKAKATSKTGVAIPAEVEKSGMVRWLAKDRTLVMVPEGGMALLRALVRTWVKVL